MRTILQVDRHTIIQILGSLMKKPDLLSNSDKYFLEPNEFTNQLDKYIFSAIYNLYLNGAERIHVADIDKYLVEIPAAKSLMEKEKGISFLQDCENESEERNFDYYYNKMKKINLVRELKKLDKKIDNIYCEDILNDDYEKINENFEKMTTVDIINSLKSSTMDLEKKYILNNNVEESKASDNIRDFLFKLREEPEIGCSLQGDILNTIVRGGRKGKLYIMSGSSGIGKSRTLVGNSAYIAYPMRYDTQVGKWVSTGSCEKVLYVMTEQDPEEIKTMILSYLTGYNEEIFLYGTFGEKEMPRIEKALQIMEEYKDNMLFARIPDPCSAIVKNLFRRYNLQYGIENFFYDYIFSSPAMLNEYRDLKIQEHVALRMFTTTLKNLAVELNSFILTSTQVSNDDDPKGGFRDFHQVQGSKSIVNLCDFGCIMSRPTVEELNQISGFKKEFGYSPNLVTDVYKNRRGRWNLVRIWSYHDLGTCRKYDLFITTATMKAIDDFTIFNFTPEYTDEDVEKFLEILNIDNESEKSELIVFQDEGGEELLDNLENAFGDFEDKKRRLEGKALSDLL